MKPSSKRLLLFGAAAAGAGALAVAAVHSLFGFAARRKPPIPLPHVTDLNNNPYADEIRSGTDWLLAQNTETVTIKNRDGLTLTGHYLPAENAKQRNQREQYRRGAVGLFGKTEKEGAQGRQPHLFQQAEAHSKPEAVQRAVPRQQETDSHHAGIQIQKGIDQ